MMRFEMVPSLASGEENFKPAKPWHGAIAAPSDAPPEVRRGKIEVLERKGILIGLVT